MAAEITIVDTTRPNASRSRRGGGECAGAVENAILACSRSQLQDLLGETEPHRVWVVLNRRSLLDVVRAVAARSLCPVKRGLISLERPTAPELAALSACFRPIVPGAEARVPLPELFAILAEERPQDFCIAVDRISSARALTLWRGDLSSLVVPLTFFPRRAGVAPNPARLSVLDNGQTIGLGEYQSSVDAILYLRDREYRRHARRRMLESDTSIGGSIRRLRKQKGLTQGDFPHVAEKTLTRIELGKSPRPHRKTLERIAKALGVPVEELDDY